MKEQDTRSSEGVSAPAFLEQTVRSLESWQDQHGRPFITVPGCSGNSHLRVNSEQALRWIMCQVMEETPEIATTRQARETIRQLEGKSWGGERHEVAVRSSLDQGRVCIDLADDEGRVVLVEPEGWRVVPGSDVSTRFNRSSGTGPLPVPERNPSGPDLRDVLNLACDDQYILFCGSLVAALWPKGPRFVTVLQGRQGTAKTTMGRVFVSLTDPHNNPVRSFPGSEQDLALSCMDRRVLLFDNLSGLRQSQSDQLCRVSSGAAHATRKLYTTDEISVTPSEASLVLTGIGSVLERPDAIDRAIILNLSRIPSGSISAEEELQARFETARPHLFALLVEGLWLALKNRNTIEAELPRMADASRVAAASMPAFGFDPADFFAAYRRNEGEAYRSAVEASPIGEALMDLVRDKGEWEGTHTALLGELDCYLTNGRRGPGWPRAANALSREITRLLPAIERQGVSVEYSRSADSSSRKLIRLTSSS